MAVQGVYTREEEKMLADWREKADKLVGWLGEKTSEAVSYPVFHRVATKELIMHMAFADDYWNPLWRDESYARNTRWGGIIAPPLFQHCITHRGGLNIPMKAPPEMGTADSNFAGDYWEFFKPIYVGDSFKVWVGRARIEDVTGDKTAPRRFKATAVLSYINQRDEVTATVHEHRFITISPRVTKKKELKFTEEYQYTPEQMEAIDRAADAEEIRGARPRYWEDVRTGEELKPIVREPVTVWDQLVEIQGFGLGVFPMREVRRQTPGRIIVDPVTNIRHKSIEFHLSERTAKLLGSYSTTLIYPTVEHFLARIITNWMGDDGFLRGLDCLKLSNTPLGDAIFGYGRVTRKHISSDGEHLVDLDVWMESVRGYISNVATATVSLLSKEKTFS